MSSGRKFLIVLILLLPLAGCYRPANELLAPVTNPTDVPATPNSASSPDTNSLPDTDIPPGLTELPVSPTLPPVTVIQPTPLVIDPATATNEVPVVNPTESQPTLEGVQPGNLPTATPFFLTPSGPVGPIVVDTATPLSPANTTATPSGLITPTGLFTSDQACTYTVQPGDNLFRIATNNNTTVDELKAENALPSDLIQPGQVLKIPGCTVGAVTAATPAPNTNATVAVDSGQQTVHTVQPGETLSIIARKYGVTITAIVDANKLDDPDRLSVGQQLIIPKQ